MAPRNSDAGPSYKKNFSVEESDAKDIVPCLLHKKHRVVKLVKNQMQKIQTEGLLCSTSGSDKKEEEQAVGPRFATRRADYPIPSNSNSLSHLKSAMMCWSILMFLIALFMLILLIVWISAGPLSNSIAHTPIPVSSFVRLENLCSLEKKYILRWGKPEYFDAQKPFNPR